MSDESPVRSIRSDEEDRRGVLRTLTGMPEEQEEHLNSLAPWILGTACLVGAYGYSTGLRQASKIAGIDFQMVLFYQATPEATSPIGWIIMAGLLGALVSGYALGRAGREPRTDLDGGGDDG